MISLTFDDALDQHLDHVAPLLHECGLVGTFYAHLSAPSLAKRWNDWQKVANAGNELGNHTVFHPADARKKWVTEGNALDHYSLDRMRLEIELANTWLQAIDGQEARTFAYPCSNSVLGTRGLTQRCLIRLGLQNTRLPSFVKRIGLDFGNTEQSYKAILVPLVFAGRGGGLHLKETSPPVSQYSRDELPSAAVARHSFAEMKGFVERSLANQSWPILQFHGINGGHHMDCTLKDFKSLLHWLSDNYRQDVVTVLQGAKKLFSER